MSKFSIQAIVLAAGKSTRFNTGNSKLLEKLCGQEMIIYPLNILETLNLPINLVVGYKANELKKLIQTHCKHPITFTLQEEPKGTGHALATTKTTWTEDHVLVINGDMPLINETIIRQLIEKHYEKSATISFVTAHHPQPAATEYGRVITENNEIKIIEAKDVKEEHHESCCINAGIYLFKKEFLENNIAHLDNKNNAQEFYLTDLIKVASNQGHHIETISAPFDHIRGINTLKELWIAEQIKRSEFISYWMERGVRFDVAQSTHVDVRVTIGAGTQIGAGVHLLNGTKIGNNCNIEPFCILDTATVGNNVTIKSHSVLNTATIENNTTIGPFAHIRNNSVIKEDACIGNFVEVNRSTVGQQSKAKHLAYIGDTTIGTQANIGAGTITCNYDGKEKHKTTIGNKAFIGSNNTLVAPVTIEDGAYTAAGSTITNNVPKDALAIGRARQINKENYMKTKKNSSEIIEQEIDSKKSTKDSSNFFGAIKTKNDLAEN